MSLTEEEARRIADVFSETVGLSPRERVARAQASVPHATHDDIKRALEVLFELAMQEGIDAKLEREELQRELDRLPKED